MTSTNLRTTSPERQWPFPAFPNGWFTVAYSDALAPQEIDIVGAKGFALFRDPDGVLLERIEP